MTETTITTGRGPGATRSREAEAFLAARRHTAPQTVSACHGWTAHDVTAHVAAAAAEVTRHLEPYLAGDPVPSTRSFEEREAPYRALDDQSLQRRLEREEQTMRRTIGDVLAAEPDAVIPWTGRRMAVADFTAHMRSEFALHRWDVVGDDHAGLELLAQPELTEHAVEAWARSCCVEAVPAIPDRMRTSTYGCVRVTGPTSGCGCTRAERGSS